MQQSLQFHQLKHWWISHIQATPPLHSRWSNVSISICLLWRRLFKVFESQFLQGLLGHELTEKYNIDNVNREWDTQTVFFNRISYWSIRHSKYSLDCIRHLELSKPFSLRHIMNLSLKAVHSPKKNMKHCGGSSKFWPSHVCCLM